MVFGFWCESAFAFSMYQRKPPEELHLGERLQGGFLPPTGRIPPNSGGWHRGVFSRSVAGARTERPLLILRQSTMRAEISARVRKYQRYYAKRELGKTKPISPFWRR